MKPATIVIGAVGAILTLTLAWLLFVALPRWSSARRAPPAVEEPVASTAATPAPATQPSAPRIKAHLFYVSDDGSRLKPEEREVPFGESTAEQARHIVEAELEPAPAPLLSAIPEGTTLKDLFIGDQGEVFVDLSAEISKNHPGGSLDEILTVYAIVDALTDNLPAVTAVQILIDGREVDTLAGHVDLRRPLRKNLTWVEAPKAADAAAAQ